MHVIDETGDHQRPVQRQTAVRAQRHSGFLLKPVDDIGGVLHSPPGGRDADALRSGQISSWGQTLSCVGRCVTVIADRETLVSVRGERSPRRRGVQLVVIGLILLAVGFGILSALVFSRPSPQSPPGIDDDGDLTDIAALITAIGGVISGTITAVTGLVLALRRPRQPDQAGGSPGPPPQGGD